MKEKTFGFLFYVWMIFCFALLAAGIYVAVHFISKYW